MTKPKVYIDGQYGTTGLQIASRLADREDIELLKIDEDLRHDETFRKEMMKQADLVFLCLPDQASSQAAKWMDLDTKVIDTSTAHRCSWCYGFAELGETQKEAIRQAKRVANPGCHATGAISLLYPLQKAGLLKEDFIANIFSLTGYSGGGRKMIAQYEDNPDKKLQAPGLYALSLQHKHIPEIKKICSIQGPVHFIPIVDDYRQGMLTSIMIDARDLQKPASKEDLHKIYRDFYGQKGLVKVMDDCPATLYAAANAEKDVLEIYINGNEEQWIVSAVFDNLGKGACGAAIQNMNIMLGLDEMAGLNV